METRDICPHGFDFTDGNEEVFCPDCCLRPGEFVYCEACADRDIHTDIPGTRNDPTYTFVCPVCGNIQTYTPQFPKEKTMKTVNPLLAYYDSFSGLIPVRITGYDADGNVSAVVTAARKNYQ